MVTRKEWAEECRRFRAMLGSSAATDDSLRSFTLGAIRSAARAGGPDEIRLINEIRAILGGLDDALADAVPAGSDPRQE